MRNLFTLPLGHKVRHRITGERWELVGLRQTRLRCRNAAGEIATFPASQMSAQGHLLSEAERRRRQQVRQQRERDRKRQQYLQEQLIQAFREHEEAGDV